MLKTPKIKLRDIKELQAENVVSGKNALTPLRKRKNANSCTTSKKLKLKENNLKTATDTIVNSTNTVTKSKKKISLKSAFLETPATQKRIDSFFTSCPKNYEIKFCKAEQPTPFASTQQQVATTKTKCGRSRNKNSAKSPRKSKKPGRKRLIFDAEEQPAETPSNLSCIKENRKPSEVEYIIIDSDSEDEFNKKKQLSSSATKLANTADGDCTTSDSTSRRKDIVTYETSLSFGQKMSTSSCKKIETTTTNSSSNVSKRKTKPCPSYKIIENTTFAVDAFQFGEIENVTHYFLTHFHADHYIGLTKSFAMPLYVSHITARLLRSFIPVEEQYIHEMELNVPYIIDNIEVTALDANHCPGAILLVFRDNNSNKCILHTGDFRAWHNMESESIFWNYTINTIYLDTTYISDKYNFCTQYESIEKAKDLIEKFQDKNAGKRILYICGSYIVGKEKFWTALAETYSMKVWAEGNRAKALKAVNNNEINTLLVDDPYEANMHVIAMGKLSYLELIEYFKLYEHHYDIVFAMRPSGWEKNSKPRYGAKINLVGIEYSEHSSYKEMQRFVRFLKPENVISTVPTGRDLMKTAKVPLSWYKYDILKPESNYQPSIESYLRKTPHTKAAIRMPNASKGGVDTFVSPLKVLNSKQKQENNHLIQNLELKEQTSNNCASKRKALSPSENSQKQESCDNLVIQSKSIFSHNSTEDFESPDLILISKKPPVKKEVLRKRNKLKEMDVKTKTAKPINLEQTRGRNKFSTNKETTTNTNNFQKNETESLRRTDFEYNSAPKDNLIESTKNVSITSNKISATNKTADQNLELPTTQNRITRSKSKSNKSSSGKSASQYETTESNESLNNNLGNLNSLTVDSMNNSKSIMNKSKTDLKTTDKLFKQKETFLEGSQRKNGTNESMTTNSKTNSTQSSANFLIKNEHNCSPLNDEIQVNNNLQEDIKITILEKRTTGSRNKFSKNSSFRFKNQTEIIAPTNSILAEKIKTELANQIERHTKELQFNLPACSEGSLNKINCALKSVTKKRPASVVKQSLTPFKKTKPSLHTHTIINTILEQDEDIDRFNCSQIAQLVVEAVNKTQPDNNIDHIPEDLLSNADNNSLSNSLSCKDQTTNDNSSLINTNSIHQVKSETIKQDFESPMPQSRTTRSQTNSSHSSLSSLKNQAQDEKQEDFEFPLSQRRRTTKPKTNSVKSLQSSTSSQNRAEKIFTEKLCKQKQQQNNIMNSYSQLNSTTNFRNSYGNPLFKSNTNSTRDSTSSDEIPTRRTKPSLNSQVILRNILKQSGDIGVLNNSQLAGLVVETLSKQQQLLQNNSKDHIPSDLLSDADDDWI